MNLPPNIKDAFEDYDGNVNIAFAVSCPRRARPNNSAPSHCAPQLRHHPPHVTASPPSQAARQPDYLLLRCLLEANRARPFFLPPPQSPWAPSHHTNYVARPARWAATSSAGELLLPPSISDCASAPRFQQRPHSLRPLAAALSAGTRPRRCWAGTAASCRGRARTARRRARRGPNPHRRPLLPLLPCGGRGAHALPRPRQSGRAHV